MVCLPKERWVLEDPTLPQARVSAAGHDQVVAVGQPLQDPFWAGERTRCQWRQDPTRQHDRPPDDEQVER